MKNINKLKLIVTACILMSVCQDLSAQTKLVHINGSLQVDSLEIIQNANSVLVLDNLTQTVALMSYPASAGDVKQGFQNSDHNGWFF